MDNLSGWIKVPPIPEQPLIIETRMKKSSVPITSADSTGSYDAAIQQV